MKVQSRWTDLGIVGVSGLVHIVAWYGLGNSASVPEHVEPIPIQMLIASSASGPEQRSAEPPRAEPPKAPKAPRPAKRSRPRAPEKSSETAPRSAPVNFDTVLVSSSGGSTSGTAASPATGGEGQGSPAKGTGAGRFVSLGSLGRPPRQPGALDSLLEQFYPAEERRTAVTGYATVRVRIAADGELTVNRVLSASSPPFGDACAAALRRSPRWGPGADADGVPVTTAISFRCRFEVEH